jgi:hypothetical protein
MWSLGGARPTRRRESKSVKAVSFTFDCDPRIIAGRIAQGDGYAGNAARVRIRAIVDAPFDVLIPRVRTANVRGSVSKPGLWWWLWRWLWRWRISGRWLGRRASRGGGWHARRGGWWYRRWRNRRGCRWHWRKRRARRPRPCWNNRGLRQERIGQMATERAKNQRAERETDAPRFHLHSRVHSFEKLPVVNDRAGSGRTRKRPLISPKIYLWAPSVAQDSILCHGLIIFTKYTGSKTARGNQDAEVLRARR